MKRNLAYKGKWHAPLIDNPNYKGIWKPQQIPNPDYFELEKPDFDPIAAIGIEIWAMQDGILFDNILIASDEKVAGNENPLTLICFASKTTNAGQITSKLHVIELGTQPGKPGFTKKKADLFFPPDFADDFPVTMQISNKYSLIYVITKLGLLFMYDLETTKQFTEIESVQMLYF